MYGIESDADFMRFHQDNLVKLREITKDLDNGFILLQPFARLAAQRRLDQLVNREASLFGIRYDLKGDVHSLARDDGNRAPAFMKVLDAKKGSAAGI